MKVTREGTECIYERRGLRVKMCLGIELISVPGPQTSAEEIAGSENEKLSLVSIINWKLLKLWCRVISSN